MGAISVEDRRRDGPQSDFTILLRVNRIGLWLRPKSIASHLTFSLKRCGPLVGAPTDGSHQKTAHHHIRWRFIAQPGRRFTQSRCVYVLAISLARDDRAFISGPSQRAVWDYSRFDAGFSPGVVKKDKPACSCQAPADLPTC
jgi:hypothetical protein